MNHLDNFISVKPALEFQQFIDSYYFHSCDNEESVLNFTYYPHIKHAVTIYLGSLSLTQGNRTVVHSQQSTNSVLYSTVRDFPQQVEIKGRFRKIGIVFKPYGLNHFITKSLHDFHHQVVSVFEEWNPEFIGVAEKIWETHEINERAALLDRFLAGKQNNSTNVVFDKIISEILRSDTNESIQRISIRYNLNRKALYRMFIKELQCSPSKFIKVLRFRKSLEAYLKAEKANLTAIAVAHFYDQSDFIRNVKKITSQTPSKLTREISDLDNTIFWKID